MEFVGERRTGWVRLDHSDVGESGLEFTVEGDCFNVYQRGGQLIDGGADRSGLAGGLLEEGICANRAPTRVLPRALTRWCSALRSCQRCSTPIARRAAWATYSVRSVHHSVGRGDRSSGR